MENGLIINIDWIYFLGIMGSLIAIAWYTNGRFSTAETDIRWLKDTIKNLKIDVDNKMEFFVKSSPIALTGKGNNLLVDSGMKDYINGKNLEFMGVCNNIENTSAYEVQKTIFDLFDGLEFEPEYDKKFKDYAYRQGVSIDIVKRVGAIYFRDICLNKFGMKKEDIDNHPNG